MADVPIDREEWWRGYCDGVAGRTPAPGADGLGYFSGYIEGRAYKYQGGPIDTDITA